MGNSNTAPGTGARPKLVAAAILIAFALGIPVAAGEPEDKVGFLAEKLRDASSFKVRLKAAVLLGRLDDPRAVRPLVKALRDDNYVVRGAAARALGNLGIPASEGAIENLFELVEDEEPFVRKEAEQALRRLTGPASLDYFTSALASSRPRVRLVAIQILARLKTPEAQAGLVTGLGDEDEEVRAEAIIAVRGLGMTEAEGLLRQALGRQDAYQIQATGARLVGELRVVALMDPLADLLVSDEVVPAVKTEAAGALRELRDQLDVAALTAQMTSEDKNIQRRAIKLLGLHGGREAVDALMDLLKAEDPFVRRRAVFALGDAGDPRAVPALEFLLKSETDTRQREQIERTLRKLRP